MFEKEASASEELTIFDHIAEEIQTEMDKLGGVYKIENESIVLSRMINIIRVLLGKFDFLSSPAKLVGSEQKNDWTENETHKKRMFFRFYLDFIEKDLAQFLEENKNIKDSFVQFSQKEQDFIKENKICLGFFDTVKTNRWKKRIFMQAHLLLFFKGKKKEK